LAKDASLHVRRTRLVAFAATIPDAIVAPKSMRIELAVDIPKRFRIALREAGDAKSAEFYSPSN
jgi:hypothetical protein